MAECVDREAVWEGLGYNVLSSRVIQTTKMIWTVALGPWVMNGHYLTVSQWFRNFRRDNDEILL